MSYSNAYMPKFVNPRSNCSVNAKNVSLGLIPSSVFFLSLFSHILGQMVNLSKP